VELSASYQPAEAQPTAGGGDVSNVGSASLSVSQTIWDGLLGGRSRKSVEQAGLTRRSKALSLESSMKGIELSVTQAYLALLSAQKTLELRGAAIDQRIAELERTRLLVEAGKASDLDRRQAELNLRSAEVDERIAASSLASVHAKLATLMGTSAETPFTAVEPEAIEVPTMELEAAVETALENRTDLKQLGLARSAGDLELLLTRAQAGPQVSASGSAGLSRDWESDRTSGNWSARLQVSVPILDSGAAKRQIELQRMENASTERDIADLEAAIRMEVAEALAAVGEARAKLELASLTLSQAELKDELARTQVEIGTGSPIEALTASVNLTGARITLLKAQGDLQVAVLQYRRSLGL